MSHFIYKKNTKTNKMYVETSYTGKALLTIPQLNKGTAFTSKERWKFRLQSKLPYRIENIKEQALRAYQQYARFSTNLEKNIYLRNLHNTNETLFFRLIQDNLEEMLPIIYTPVIAEAVKCYSTEYRKPRGLYIAYPDRHRIREILSHRTNYDIDLIVASDAEGILGIGDQGVGGIEIPVAKLAVYTLCAGLHPSRYLPIFLDAGTNNKTLLKNPFYLGWRHKRVGRKAYDEMIRLFIKAVKNAFPNVFLHWEDFGRDNARRNLERYQNELCSFNDDMQGTAAVTLSALLAACMVAKQHFAKQRIVIFGAGTAGSGIADAIYRAMLTLGLSAKKARGQFWLIDRSGLLLESTRPLARFQAPYARQTSEVRTWKKNSEGNISLDEVIKQVKPTTLIGCSTQQGAFNARILKKMAANHKHPIIFPLSNPTELAEATPLDILKHTFGKALIATGSPFDEVIYNKKSRYIPQCNNALVFPGIGLGVIAIGAKKLTNNMLWQACKTLSSLSPARVSTHEPILPRLKDAHKVSKKIAHAVAKQAIKDGVATLPKDKTIAQLINQHTWKPEYFPYKLVASKK